MLKKYSLGFLGGDERQKYCANELSKFYNINGCGEVFKNSDENKISYCDNPFISILKSDILILPMPAVKAESIISIEEVAKKINLDKQKLILGGLFSPYQKGIMDSKKIHYTDYATNESLNIHNAYVTAEGAISLAMRNTIKTIRFSKVAIIGYGRIGKALTSMLNSMFAKVTVFARREESVSLAFENGADTEIISSDQELDKLKYEKFDIIFNTVPERIINNNILLQLNAGTLIIELASAPGGFDIDIAKQGGLKVIDGRGLPGKYAPESSGKALSKVILKYIN